MSVEDLFVVVFRYSLDFSVMLSQNEMLTVTSTLIRIVARLSLCPRTARMEVSAYGVAAKYTFVNKKSLTSFEEGPSSR